MRIRITGYNSVSSCPQLCNASRDDNITRRAIKYIVILIGYLVCFKLDWLMSSMGTGFVGLWLFVCVVKGFMWRWGVWALNLFCAATPGGGFLYYILKCCLLGGIGEVYFFPGHS